MPLNKVNVAEALDKVEQPFTLVEVARVGSLVMHAYVCLGMVQWHRHVDHDELFLVQDGWITLESEWGNVTLKAGEMVVVPKGVGHRSGAQLRSIVLLVQPAAAADRKNGHRRIFAIPGENELQKVKLAEAATRTDLFRPEPMADIEELAAQVVVGQGVSHDYVNTLSGSLWLVMSGEAQLEVGGELLDVAAGELVVIDRNVPHRWASSTRTTMFLLSGWAEQA